jgi:6,7-dimethyl-8-ribityllumazine synthase
MDVISGRLIAEGVRLGIAASRFNDVVVSRLVEGAVDAFIRHGGTEDDIKLVWVPGSLELPLAARWLIESGCDAVVCLGVIMKGETEHYHYVASECASGIAKLSLEHGIPVIYGVLTTETLEQALHRAGAKLGNRGYDAALAAIEMYQLKKALNSKSMK